MPFVANLPLNTTVPTWFETNARMPKFQAELAPTIRVSPWATHVYPWIGFSRTIPLADYALNHALVSILPALHAGQAYASALLRSARSRGLDCLSQGSQKLVHILVHT